MSTGMEKTRAEQEDARTADTRSPFVVGRPLRDDEPIFGRDEVFRAVAEMLSSFSSVNLIGERRMGKTSLINHLVGSRRTRVIPHPKSPPLVLACVDLQASVSNQSRFFGRAMRSLLDGLPPSRSQEAEWFSRLHRRRTRPEADYDEFEDVLRRLRQPRGICVQPVLVVDEFEVLLEPSAAEGFPYPAFFNGLRALITADLVALVVASRKPLADYFTDPNRPGTLTSTFPSYFFPVVLSAIDAEAADALLLQPSGHPLTVREAAIARRWAGGHPCHLQVAGQARYEAKQRGRTEKWVRRRFEDLKRQCCLTGLEEIDKGRGKARRELRLPGKILRAAFWDAPMRVGRVAQRLGKRFDDVAAWIIGVLIIGVLLLVAVGVVDWEGLWRVIKKGLGLP